uniref:Uncharacterized protein n=1 Tax=Arundo donax TaxID=35708 RepID=A0A0A9BIX9_ARUDO
MIMWLMSTHLYSLTLIFSQFQALYRIMVLSTIVLCNNSLQLHLILHLKQLHQK